jgi:hypothetical protein
MEEGVKPYTGPGAQYREAALSAGREAGIPSGLLGYPDRSLISHGKQMKSNWKDRQSDSGYRTGHPISNLKKLMPLSRSQVERLDRKKNPDKYQSLDRGSESFDAAGGMEEGR